LTREKEKKVAGQGEGANRGNHPVEQCSALLRKTTIAKCSKVLGKENELLCKKKKRRVERKNGKIE